MIHTKTNPLDTPTLRVQLDGTRADGWWEREDGIVFAVDTGEELTARDVYDAASFYRGQDEWFMTEWCEMWFKRHFKGGK